MENDIDELGFDLTFTVALHDSAAVASDDATTSDTEQGEGGGELAGWR